MRAGLAARLRSRPPLVPKEMIGPVCQRLFLVLFVMCGAALSIRLFALWKMGKLAGHERISFTPVNGTRFFLDISSGEHAGVSATKMLEESGWRGVCASPFPEAKRSCKAMSMAVAPTDGEQVTVTDCSQSTTMQVLMSAVSTVNCPLSQRSGVGIKEMIQLSKAPNVIDYVTLNTGGSELSLLNKFPFDKFCVRSWTVTHRGQDSAQIQTLFKSRGCTVKPLGDGCWVRCSCSSFAQSLMHVRAAKNVGAKPLLQLVQKASARARKKSSARAIMSSGMQLEVSPEDLPASADPLAEGSHLLGGASGLGGSLLRSQMH